MKFKTKNTKKFISYSKYAKFIVKLLIIHEVKLIYINKSNDMNAKIFIMKDL